MLNVGRVIACGVFALFFTVATSHAALIDRGGGLIYDDVLNITWLQDVGYAQTSGGAPFGRLTWPDAVAWADGLVYEDPLRGTSWDGWRLPSTINDASSMGFDTTGQSSELAYMYYVNLGYAPNTSGDQSAPSPESTNYNPFVNLRFRGIWSGTQAYTNEAQAWYLHFHFGSQGVTSARGDSQLLWAVRDGDVGAAQVPEPATLALLGLGLFGARLRRKGNR